jgi:hypothetical protein
MFYALGKPRERTCFWVQVEQGGGMTAEYTGQEELHKAIWESINRKQFYLAELAPLCQQPLHRSSHYNAILQEILQ